jgi:hypothetical protein
VRRIPPRNRRPLHVMNGRTRPGFPSGTRARPAPPRLHSMFLERDLPSSHDFDFSYVIFCVKTQLEDNTNWCNTSFASPRSRCRAGPHRRFAPQVRAARSCTRRGSGRSPSSGRR